MATITGDHVGYPGFQDLGNFLQGEKKILERKFTRLSASNFCGRVTVNVFLLIHRLSDNYIGGTEGLVYLTSSLI